MIEFLSSWAKSLGLAIVIVSILEMLLPNNKNKKYIRMVMGIYIIFNIISPFVKNQDVFNIENINIEKYALNETTEEQQVNKEEVNQTSMNKRIEELYIEELEKDITKKMEEQGYKVNSCKVEASISNDEGETEIKEIRIKVEKNQTEDKNNEEEENIENKLVTEIQKIKKVDTTVNKQDGNDNEEEKEENTVSKADIQNIKKFLIEEYEVNEKCLKIN